MSKSRILIIGATGYIGPYIARASSAAGHPTFVLVRPETLINPAKVELIESFKKSGICILRGSLEDYESLLDAVRKVDIIISAVGTRQLLDQLNIIKAIKEVGSIKRFVPSDFGSNQVSLDALPDPLKTAYEPKQQIRAAISKEGIPFTIIFTYGFAGVFLASLGQLDCKAPPRDKVIIFGDGNGKVICVTEENIATCTILAAVDPRTENKYVHIRPPTNILSQNEMVSLWEEKLGKLLEKTHISGESVLQLMEETPYPKSIGVALRHTVFVRGSHFLVKLGLDDVDATDLYPDLEYTSAGNYLDSFV
eukprot:c23826_g1_i2 orf=129-1052(+)